MTIERLNFPRGLPINDAPEVNLHMVRMRDDFVVVPPGEYVISPKVKPRGFKYSRKMKVYEKGSAIIGPNVNPEVIIHDVASHPAGEPGTNSSILLTQPGDVFILTTPNRQRDGALLQDIILFSNKKVQP